MYKYLPFYRQNIRLAIPIILSQAGQIVVQQMDILMVGYVSTVQLAASAFANSIFVIGLVMLMGFSYGLTPAIGHQISNKSTINIDKMLSSSFFLNITFAIIISIILYFTSYLFKFMGQEDDVIKYATPYFYTLILSLLPFVVFMTNKQFAEGIGNTKYAMYVTIISNLINIGLNYILIFGKFGAPALGLFGAGIATFIARLFLALSFLLIFKYNSLFKTYFKNIKLAYINKVSIKTLFSIGLPISVQMLLEVSAFAISAIMAGWLGAVSLAANQIAIGLASISFMIVTGIGSATTIRIAHQYSHKDLPHLIMAAKASIHIVLAFMGMAAISFIVFRNYFPKIYTHDPHLIALTAPLLIIVGLFQLFDGLQVIMLSILRGLGDVKHAMVYAFIAYIVINLPLGYYLGFKLNMGLTGLWIAFIIGLGSAAILFLYRFRTIYSKLKIKLKTTA